MKYCSLKSCKFLPANMYFCKNISLCFYVGNGGRFEGRKFFFCLRIMQCDCAWYTVLPYDKFTAFFGLIIFALMSDAVVRAVEREASAPLRQCARAFRR